MILGSSIRTIIYDKCVCFWHVLLLVITMQCFASRSNAMCLFLLHTDAQLRCSHSDKQIFLQCLIQTNTALVFASGQKCTRLIALSARPRLFSGWMSQWTIPWTTRNSAIFGCVFPSVRRAQIRSGAFCFSEAKKFYLHWGDICQAFFGQQLYTKKCHHSNKWQNNYIHSIDFHWRFPLLKPNQKALTVTIFEKLITNYAFCAKVIFWQYVKKCYLQAYSPEPPF